MAGSGPRAAGPGALRSVPIPLTRAMYVDSQRPLDALTAVSLLSTCVAQGLWACLAQEPHLTVSAGASQGTALRGGRADGALSAPGHLPGRYRLKIFAFL
jgi:hypothetical protein